MQQTVNREDIVIEFGRLMHLTDNAKKLILKGISNTENVERTQMLACRLVECICYEDDMMDRLFVAFNKLP